MSKHGEHDKNYPRVTGKWARERAERGFSSRDTWCFDMYLCHVLAGYFDNEMRNGIGTPCAFFYRGKTYTDGTWSGKPDGFEEDGVIHCNHKRLEKMWRKTQKLMRDAFRDGTTDEMMFGDKAEETYARIDEALLHLKENFGRFWN